MSFVLHRSSKNRDSIPPQTLSSDPPLAVVAATPSLPKGWECRYDTRNHAYYVDHNTRSTTWVRPRVRRSQSPSNTFGVQTAAAPTFATAKNSINGDTDIADVISLSSERRTMDPAEKTPSFLSTMDHTSQICLQPVNKTSGVCVALTGVAKGLSALIKQRMECIADKDDFRRILLRTELLLASLTWPTENEMAGSLERRTDLKSKLDTIVAELDPVLQEDVSDSLKNIRITQKIAKLVEDIRGVIMDYQTSLQQAIYERDCKIIDPDDLMVLNKLIHANNADHLSGNRQRCLRGTRTQVLRDIEWWAEDRNNGRVYWLNGVAGCGKTTIAGSFADYAFAEGQLGASFFCSGDFADRNDLKLIFPTLAFELAHRSRDFRAHLVQVIRTTPNIGHESLSIQLEKLLIKPLRSIGLRIIIIIDALDECKDDEPASAILSLLARYIHDIPSVKFFITGRPEPRIRSGFRLPLLRPFTEVFTLHRVDPESVNQDIEIFMKTRLTELAGCRAEEIPWPDDRDVRVLVQKSGGFFIYADTILKLVSADKSPHDRLRSIVSMPDSTREEGSSGLDVLYNRIIKRNYTEGIPPSFLDRLRLIMATIVLAFNPLSRASLATLLDVRSDAILMSLRLLHSLLLIPDSNSDPIRAFHKSFSDYLTDPSRCKDTRFYVDSGVYHAKVAIRCLELMQSRLRKNICNLPRYVMNKDIKYLSTCREECIGDALEYACRFWAKHLILASRASEDDIARVLELLNEIILRHFLAWLEVLSVVGDLRGAVHSLLNVEAFLIELKTLNMSLLSSIGECRRFVLYFFDCIEASAPHIYDSVLLWPPTTSFIRTRYQDQRMTPVKVLNAIDTSWDVCIRSTQLGKGMNVESVAFSHKGDLIAGGGADALQIFEAATGACLATLNGHDGYVNSVAFSPDDMLLVSGSEDTTTRVWDVQTGGLVCILGRNSGGVSSIAVSPTGSVVASGGYDNTIRIWNVSSGCCEHVLKGHSNYVYSVCWLNARELVSGCWDGTVKVWNVSTGACSNTFRNHTSWVSCVGCSPDASKIVSGSDDKTVKIFDPRTGDIVQTFTAGACITSVCFSPKGNKVLCGAGRSVIIWDTENETTMFKYDRGSPITAVAFAPDESCIASGSRDGFVKVLHTKSRDQNPNLWDQHFNRVYCVSFAADGRTIASGSGDRTVKLWNPITGSCLHTFDGHSDSVRSLAFSSDASLLASGSDDKTIRIWTVRDRSPITTLKHDHRVAAIAFSPDGRQLVSLCRSAQRSFIVLWDVAEEESLVNLELGGGLRYSRMSFSADGTRIILKNGDVTKGWEIEWGQEQPRVRGDGRPRAMTLHLRPIEGYAISSNLPPQLHYKNESDWIMDQHSRRVCWIPPDCRGISNDVHGKKVVIGNKDGRVIMLDFSDTPLF